MKRNFLVLLLLLLPVVAGAQAPDVTPPAVAPAAAQPLPTATGVPPVGAAVPSEAPAVPAPPVQDEALLNYLSVLHAMLRLDKFKPDNQDYLDSYAFVAHCDVVQGSFGDEFKWARAREAVKKWIAINKDKRPLRLAVYSQIMFARYDFQTQYFLFSDQTRIDKLNTFLTENRLVPPVCDKPIVKLMPQRFQVVTNNPLTLPGLRLTAEQARDLARKFQQQNNPHRIAWIRFLIDITDADYLGPSIYANQSKGDTVWTIKATLHAVEFFSDPHYRNRFFYFVPY